MDIHVVTGKGEGTTLLSSFDAALKDSGVYNYNLIYLSSVVPPQAKIQDIGKLFDQPGIHGDRLYVVIAREQSDVVGTVIGSAVGWYQFDSSGAGVFVEHHIQGTHMADVSTELERLITYSVRDLCHGRGIPFEKEKCHSALSVMTVQNRPATVCVLAVFQHEPWRQQHNSHVSGV